jgi:hypothetical protein
LLLVVSTSRPKRTSWLMVGIGNLFPFEATLLRRFDLLGSRLDPAGAAANQRLGCMQRGVPGACGAQGQARQSSPKSLLVYSAALDGASQP